MPHAWHMRLTCAARSKVHMNTTQKIYSQVLVASCGAKALDFANVINKSHNMTIVYLRSYLALRISSKSWILQATRGAFYFECVATVLL